MCHELHIVVFLVAHPRKGGTKELDSDDISGSGGMANLSERVLTLDIISKKKNDGEKVNLTLLAVQKNRATGVLIQGNERILLRHNKKSKRLYQAGDSGVVQFPFDADTARAAITKLPF